MLKEIVISGDYEALAKALENQSEHDIDELTNSLVASVKNGDEKVVGLLLSCGADPNLVPQGGLWSAMHNAVENQNLSLLKLLLKNGGNVNLSDVKGLTLLHLSVDIEADSAYQADETPSANITKFLLEFGAKVDVKDQSGQTPLDIAEEYEYKEAIELLKLG